MKFINAVTKRKRTVFLDRGDSATVIKTYFAMVNLKMNDQVIIW
jgi:hypothetical protein